MSSPSVRIARMAVVSFPFASLASADLVVDAIYQGGREKTAADDPLAKLLPVGNQGGFRVNGRRRVPGCRIVVLFSTGAEPDWPDSLDPETGVFTYFGDNRHPGRALESTDRGGNLVLREAFEATHGEPELRVGVPPFLVFTRAGVGRDVRFRGLAVPGAPSVRPTDDLVAIWRTTQGQRFQNYRATFTILNAPVVTRQWLKDMLAGNPLSSNAPDVWQRWVAGRVYVPLRSPRTLTYRTRDEQTPATQLGRTIVACIQSHFSGAPAHYFEFEKCAARLVEMMDANIVEVDVTRPWADGGRDALGLYRIGPAADPVKVEFALEAKCYGPSHAVGVKEVARLVSRLRFRQFGILVTTSYLHRQAYEEIRQDGHPVIVLSGVDIVGLLQGKGLGTVAAVKQWLAQEFPVGPALGR